ncbi:MAG: hypothetical protein M1511_12545 [Deltaproteobacteria bacterium]|nr:hypothetical protein [Deltaproteobacteria bacterium]
MAKKKVSQSQTKDKPSPTEQKYSFEEIYKAVTHLLINGTKEQQAKVWKQLNEGEGDWVWMKMKVITDAYSAADAKAREEFSMIAISDHLKSGNVVQIEDYTDEETGIKYRQYRRRNNLIWRIPYATDGMDKYAYDKALNKHFLGDYIELQTAGGDEVTLIPLDTPEKVKDQNSGGHYYTQNPLYQNPKPIVLKRKKEPGSPVSPKK